MGGENGDGDGTGWPAWAERYWGTGKVRFGTSGEGSGEMRVKILQLVRDVQKYWGSTQGRAPIRFGSYNIRNVRNG